jgi:hypothetical protein
MLHLFTFLIQGYYSDYDAAHIAGVSFHVWPCVHLPNALALEIWSSFSFWALGEVEPWSRHSRNLIKRLGSGSRDRWLRWELIRVFFPV